MWKWKCKLYIQPKCAGLNSQHFAKKIKEMAVATTYPNTRCKRCQLYKNKIFQLTAGSLRACKFLTTFAGDSDHFDKHNFTGFSTFTSLLVLIEFRLLNNS